MKKKTTILITLITILCLLASTTVMASAATVKISKKSTTINAGSSTTLKITGTTKKISWSSSSKSIASVASTGKYSAKVTAKKAGTAKITAKVGTKKYTCKVTVKYATGSRQNPADPTLGVKVKDSYGTMYFKVTESYRRGNAIDKLKELNEWGNYAEYSYENREPGTDLLLLKYEVKALSGYDKYALTGSDIINSYGVYNGNCNSSIDNFDSFYLDKNDRNDLELYGGAEGTMYFCAYVPNDLSAFSTYIYNSGFNKYWIKYNI